MEVRPQGQPQASSLQRQSFAGNDREDLRRIALLDLETRADVLRDELDRQLSRREQALRSMLDRSLAVPVAGHLSSPFGWRMHPVLGETAFHRGLDFSAPAGTPVQAAAAGVISFIGPADTYGKLVVVNHGGRMQSRYAHLEGIEVTTGMAVTVGQRIGRVGSTGRSTGPHLHFELVLDGRVVNPKPFLDTGAQALLAHAPAA